MKVFETDINRAAILKLIGGSLLLAATACAGRSNHSGDTNEPGLPVITLKTGEATVTQQYSASVEGLINVEIRPQVSGYLEKIYVDEGAFVRQGQTLFKIDSRTFEEQYNNSKGALMAAKANLLNAKIDVDKRKELVKSGVVSTLQLNQAEASFEAAKAAVTQAEAALKTASINLDFCTIKAPVSGYIGRIPFRLGSLISPTQPPLTLLSDVHEVNVYFSMSETDFTTFQNRYRGERIEEKLKNVPPVKLLLSDGTEFKEKGHINAVEGQFDKNTGSITLRASFPNPNGLLRSGNTGKILLEQKYQDVALVPIASTTSIQNKIYVFSLDKDNRATQTAIEVNGKNGQNYMVTKGVGAGDRIVESGFERLQSGMKIKPTAPTKDTKVAKVQ